MFCVSVAASSAHISLEPVLRTARWASLAARNGLVPYFLRLTAMMEGDAGAASRVFASVRARHTRIEDMMTAVLGQTFTGLAQWWRGNPEETIALANEMFRWIDLSETFVAGRPLDCFPHALL